MSEVKYLHHSHYSIRGTACLDEWFFSLPEAEPAALLGQDVPLVPVSLDYAPNVNTFTEFIRRERPYANLSFHCLTGLSPFFNDNTPPTLEAEKKAGTLLGVLCFVCDTQRGKFLYYFFRSLRERMLFLYYNLHKKILQLLETAYPDERFRSEAQLVLLNTLDDQPETRIAICYQGWEIEEPACLKETQQGLDTVVWDYRVHGYHVCVRWNGSTKRVKI